MSYEEVYDTLLKLCSNENFKDLFKKKSPIGITTFEYPINYYTLGNGNKNVVLMAATHGCELITVTFIIEFIHTLLCEKDKYVKYLEDYTFHIIPILNPEGYIISSSNVICNIKNMNIAEFEKYSKEYLRLYDIDDYNAKHFEKKCDKLYKTLMTTSIDFIQNENLRKQVEKILKECNLDSRVLPIWSSNGMGIDPNANSIHQFENFKKLKEKQKFGKLRYNDIPIDRPSPHAYCGDSIFDKRCPENIALYNFIQKIYTKNLSENLDEKLFAFFSYHSTGGEIYGYPYKNYASEKHYQYNVNGMNIYSKYTGYECIDEDIKYGVMDYYRIALKDVITLTIELSKLNANPIGPFANIKNNVELEIHNNINAIFGTLNWIKNNNSHLYK